MTEEEELGPLRARSELVGMLMQDPKNVEALVAIVQNELEALKDNSALERMTETLDAAADRAKVSDECRDVVLYWLTESEPSIRQMILVETIEQLLSNDASRETALEALGRVSSPESVEVVMSWVERGILTTTQAVYVLLYPDASAALRPQVSSGEGAGTPT